MKAAAERLNGALGSPDAGETVIARYEYDALNRRTKEFVNADTDDDFDSFRHFYYTFGVVVQRN